MLDELTRFREQASSIFKSREDTDPSLFEEKEKTLTEEPLPLQEDAGVSPCVWLSVHVVLTSLPPFCSFSLLTPLTPSLPPSLPLSLPPCIPPSLPPSILYWPDIIPVGLSIIPVPDEIEAVKEKGVMEMDLEAELRSKSQPTISVSTEEADTVFQQLDQSVTEMVHHTFMCVCVYSPH